MPQPDKDWRPGDNARPARQHSSDQDTKLKIIFDWTSQVFILLVTILVSVYSILSYYSTNFASQMAVISLCLSLSQQTSIGNASASDDLCSQVLQNMDVPRLAQQTWPPVSPTYSSGTPSQRVFSIIFGSLLGGIALIVLLLSFLRLLQRLQPYKPLFKQSATRAAS